MTRDAADPEGEAPRAPTVGRKRFGSGRGIGIGIFVLAAVVYGTSVPTGFNTVYQNRRLFDSDGEFIIRQYRKDKTFTHNDHLLYHVLGARLVPLFERRLSRADSILWGHLSMSIFFGALGLAAAYRIGQRMTGTRAGALAGCVLLGSAAGYWFFSSTIDTYIPSLCFSILAMGAALDCLARKRARDAARLGAYAGLAFLFRTDGFLLVFLAPAICLPWAGAWRRAGACLATGLVVGVLGYALLANRVYEVPLRTLPGWAFGHAERPERGEEWGRAQNLSAPNIKLALYNAAIYSVILPGLENTGDRHFRQMMGRIRLGRVVLYAYLGLALATLVGCVRGMLRDARQRRWDRIMPLLLALAWFVSNLLLHTWWDPKDPFLFAVITLPALWVVCLVYLRGEAAGAEGEGLDGPRPPAGRTAIVWAMAAIVMAHNLAHLVRPLRALPVPASEAPDNAIATAGAFVR